jgi:predicted deacylase
VDPEAFGQIEKGLISLLRHLRMLPGTPSPAERAIFIGSRSNVSSDFDGIFYRRVKAGEHVEAGAALGYITDFFGRRLSDLRAPKRGVILSIFGTPPVRKGETVAVIGHADEPVR